MKVLVGASLLSADFSRLAQEVRKVELAGIDFVHIDIMDGNFVPNITFGPKVVRDLRKETKLVLESHLMIRKPLKFLKEFLEAGSDWLALHIETLQKEDVKKAYELIKKEGKKFGLALNPDTPLEKVEEFLDLTDFILVMTVFPGFGGQRFIKECLKKIEDLRKIYKKDISVDGGINDLNAKECIDKGANILCSGSFLFFSQDIEQAIRRLRNED